MILYTIGNINDSIGLLCEGYTTNKSNLLKVSKLLSGIVGHIRRP